MRWHTVLWWLLVLQAYVAIPGIGSSLWSWQSAFDYERLLAGWVPGETVPPLLTGVSYWRERWPDWVVEGIEGLCAKTVRWGGNDLDRRFRDLEDVVRFASIASRCGLVPIVQVNMARGSPEQAAEWVREVVVEHGFEIPFWSIGNEPDLWPYQGWRKVSPEEYVREWRDFARHIKEAVPTVRLVGPDISLAPFRSLDDPDHQAARWLRAFLAEDGDLVNVVSVHWYPFRGNETDIALLLGEPRLFTERMTRLRELVRELTGREIPVAVTETNLTWNWKAHGPAAGDSIFAGLRLAEIYGRAAQVGLLTVNTWSTWGDNTLSLFGWFESTPPRPTYYALLAYKGFAGRLVPCGSELNTVASFCSYSEVDRSLHLVVVNKGDMSLRMELVPHVTVGGGIGSVALEVAEEGGIVLPPYSIASLVFDPVNRGVSGWIYDGESGQQSVGEGSVSH
ncbi:hypothetical protein DRJ54_05045 [Candidatus Acetothermia bacterium]|nr:MAG: hypothetical protein DRJ54_05045 [Candidatus Acetothermia bacterium]